MQKEKVLTLILAGGAGGRLGLLTDNRAKPVVPYAGFYRLIDFALSNCLHSKMSDVWVIEQYEPHQLNEHLANGRPWDLDRTYGGLRILPPFEQDDEKSDDKGGFAEGNADSLFRQLDLIEEFKPDIILVLSADHVYKFDFRDAIETHLAKKAALTMVTTKVPEGDSASRFGVVEAGKGGIVENFEYKPEQPKSDVITTEIFVYDAKILIETLKKLKKQYKQLKDYGDQLIPYLVKQGNVYEHRLKGYWRDVGTIESYWESQIDFLDEKEKFIFDDTEWQILTRAQQRVPAFIRSSADVHNSFVAQGCIIQGTVTRSVLSAGVKTERGSEITDSIILLDAVIEKDVKIKRVIVDAGVKVDKKKLKKIEELQKKDKNAIIVIGKRKIQSSKEIEND